jgi:hypothetical protein
MLTQNDKRQRGSFNRGIENHQATVNSFGWNSHKYLANGDSDNISKFCALQIVGDIVFCFIFKLAEQGY